MSPLIEAIHIRGGCVAETHYQDLTFLELILPIRGLQQTAVQIKRTYSGSVDKEELILEALREAQAVLDVVHDNLFSAQE